jgi:nucleoside-diphosphate-sugar epimerase
MKVLVTGAAGMLGRKFCQELAARGEIAGRKVESLTMVDIVDSPPILRSPFAVRSVACDLGAPGVAEQLVADHPEIILHTAAVVSGEAEADFDKGYRINVDGTRYLFEAIPAAGHIHKFDRSFWSAVSRDHRRRIFFYSPHLIRNPESNGRIVAS